MKKIFLMRHSIPEKGDMPNEQIPLSEEGKALAVSKRNIFSNVSSGPALVDILDKLIRMDVVAKEAPINDENDVSHGRKLPTVPPAFPSAAFSPVLHILLSYSSSFHSFPSL